MFAPTVACEPISSVVPSMPTSQPYESPFEASPAWNSFERLHVPRAALKRYTVPGFGGGSSMAICLPLALAMSPLDSMVFLINIYAGVHYGGGVPAVLLGVPGDAGAAATVLDGFRMTRKGQAAEALSLTELPKHELVLQLAYERGGFFGSVEMNHRSRFLESVGGRRAEDRFQPTRNQWDLSLSYTWNKRWRVFLDAENLLEAPERSYEGEPGHLEDYSLEPRTFRLGVKWEL